MQGMTSNWSSAATHAVAFMYNFPHGSRSFLMSVRESAETRSQAGMQVSVLTDDEAERNACFFYDILHLFSLLHAVSVQDLRLDLDLDNLIENSIHCSECNPSTDSNLNVGFEALSSECASNDWFWQHHANERKHTKKLARAHTVTVSHQHSHSLTDGRSHPRTHTHTLHRSASKLMQRGTTRDASGLSWHERGSGGDFCMCVHTAAHACTNM